MSYLATVYATDEDVLIRASGDFAVLCPAYQSLAYGLDGVVAGWTLTSTAVDFGANGVTAGHVVQLTKPVTTYKGAGEILVIASVAAKVLTLRRPGKAAGVGMPPAAVASGVEFRVATLDPQIEEASFDLNRRFNIDPSLANRAPTSLYDLRELRQACVLTVLSQRFAAENRSPQSDFALKLGESKQALSEVLGRLNLRWTATGDDHQSSTWFSTRLER